MSKKVSPPTNTDALQSSLCWTLGHCTLIRMNSFPKKGRTEDSLIKKYQTNLERLIERCDQSLVCRDDELCKEVKVLLRNGNAQKMHHLYGLDSLKVLEKSLQTIPYKTGQAGLEGLSKAFEVLELAALNLYIYPWRSEYRTVKMFSGMFTHSIKSALTLQQAKELFGLLGYEPSSPKEEELVLNSKRVPADVLLTLACGFFVARMECQMLLYTLGSLNKDVEWVVQLVKERQAGHNLQVALENTKKKSDAACALNASLPGEIDSDLDLYTGEADYSHEESSSFPPSRSPYMESKVSVLGKPLHSNQSQSDVENNDDARRGKSHNNMGPADQSECDAPKQAAAKELCRCITPDVTSTYRCEKCKDIHSSICSRYKECKVQRHTLVDFPGKSEELNSTRVEKSKDSMKTHFCMINSTSDSFLVCYDCQLIHDHSCISIKGCKSHLVKPTGKVQLPQEERVSPHKRHGCLSSGAPECIICHTCNIFHDYTCQDWQNCIKNGHCIQHSQEIGDSESPSFPMTYHHCSTDQSWPTILCFTCRVFHFSKCVDGWECSNEHKIEKLSNKCTDCLKSDLFRLCRYCGALYCKECWFKNPLFCKCGKPFNPSTSV